MNTIGFIPVYISVFCLMLASALAVSSLQESWLFQIGSLLFWTVVYGMGLLLGYHHSRKPNPFNEQIMNAVAAIGLVAFLATLATGSLQAALAALLMWLQAAKNFTLCQRRDLYFAFTITFILMLYGAATSTSTAYLFYMIAYVLAGTLSLVTNFIDERLTMAQASGSQVDRHHVPIKYSVTGLSLTVMLLAASLYLFVPRPDALNLGAFFSGGGTHYHKQDWEAQARDGKDIPQQEEFSDDDTGTASDATSGDSSKPDMDADGNGGGNGVDSGIDSGANSGLGSNDGDGDGRHAGTGQDQDSASRAQRRASHRRDDFSYAGFQQVLDMNQIGKAGNMGNVLVMYVQANQPLYLRGRVFDTFTDNTWRDSDNRRHKYTVDDDGIELGEQHEHRVQQVITLKQNISNQIFAASKLEKLKFPGSVIARDRYGSIFSPMILRTGTIYSAQSYIPLAGGRPSTGAMPLGDRQRYLQLPDKLDARFAQLAQTISRGAATNFNKAVTLENYLRNEFLYTRDTMQEPFDMATLQRFLFETRRGHCELFASAMVLMLRTLNVPARLATGFSATNLNPITGYYEVRSLDAHAWVEAWTETDGWVSYEPTSFYTLPQPQQPATTAQALKQYLENLSRSTQVSEPGSVSDITLSTAVGALQEVSSMLGVVWDMIKAVFSSLVQWLKSLALPIAIGIVLLAAGYFAYLRLKHPILTRLALLRLSRLGSRNPKQRIVECYTEMENYFARMGQPRRPGTPLIDYADTLAGEYQTLQKSIYDISRQANLALYSNDTCSEESARLALQGFKHISGNIESR